jgi:hypothetical protein
VFAGSAAPASAATDSARVTQLTTDTGWG